MWHVGIDLHRRTLVVAAVHDSGEVRPPVHLDNSETQTIRDLFADLKPFCAVIEATGTYRWLHDLLAPMGTVLLAHPLRLRAMIVRRAKSDRLDAQLLANLLRLNQIPLAYVPPAHYQMLRDLVRYRTHLSRQIAHAKTQLRQLLARQNIQPPYRFPFGRPAVSTGSRARNWAPSATRCATVCSNALRWRSDSSRPSMTR